MTGDLSARLAALAQRAPDAPLDLGAVTAAARRRVLRRRALALLPVLLLALAVPVAWTAVREDDRGEVLRSAGPGAVRAEELVATVFAEVRPAAGAAPNLQVTVVGGTTRPLVSPDPSSPLLTFTAEREPGSYRAFVTAAEAVEAAAGDGVLGIGGACGRGWGGQGERLGDPCPTGEVVASLAVPGQPQSTPLRLWPVVGDRRAAPGVYRAVIPLDAGEELQVTVTVARGEPRQVRESPDSRQTSFQVFFAQEPVGDCTNVSGVTRTVPRTEAVLTAALEALFAGPTQPERARGLSGFGDGEGLLRSVFVEDGTAYVDLDASRLSGTYSTSCGSAAFFAMLAPTVTQFPSVDGYVLALDGDPKAFVEFMQGACPKEGTLPKECDPAPFRR